MRAFGQNVLVVTVVSEFLQLPKKMEVRSHVTLWMVFGYLLCIMFWNLLITSFSFNTCCYKNFRKLTMYASTTGQNMHKTFLLIILIELQYFIWPCTGAWTSYTCCMQSCLLDYKDSLFAKYFSSYIGTIRGVLGNYSYVRTGVWTGLCVYFWVVQAASAWNEVKV